MNHTPQSEKEIEKSNCCGAKIVSSGIPFDGTNEKYTKMCAKCGDIPERKSWQEVFLKAGTELTGVDLSCMIKTVSDIRQSARAERDEEVSNWAQRWIEGRKNRALSELLAFITKENTK